MTTAYRLPDGTEVPPSAIGGAKPNTHIWVEHPTLGSIAVDSALVNEVKPPLPPEPPRDTYWYDPMSTGGCWYRTSNVGGWFRTGDDEPYRWGEVCELTDPTQWIKMVPAPATDAPELPWECEDDDGDTLKIKPYSGTGRVEVHVIPGGSSSARRVDLTPARARTAAAALLRAAREVEQS